MPPKKKPRLDVNQKTLSSFLGQDLSDSPSSSASTISITDLPPSSGESVTSPTLSSSHRGALASWQAFNTPKYKSKHEWLMFKEDGIYCKYCSKVKPRVQSSCNTFILQAFTGNRPDKLVQHERAQSHMNSALQWKESLVRDVTAQRVSDMILTSNHITADGEAFCDALRCLYFLIKKELPHTTNFADLQDLCIQLGNETLPRLLKAKNLNNRSEQRIAEMVEAIGESLECEILQEARNSPYFSVIFDESTDISVTKSLGLVIQYLNRENKPVVRNLALLELKSCTADVITDKLLTYLSDHCKLKLDQLAGGASDGASVMTGCNTGVMTRIKSQVPLFISTHCSAHRLSLACVDAANDSHLVSRFHLQINQIYSFFSRSSVRTAELKEMQTIISTAKIKLQQGTETRWLSNQNAVDALRKTIKAVKLVCEEEAVKGDATALGLSTILKKTQFIATLLSLSDILEVLGKMSRCFQSNNLNLLSLENILTYYLTALEAIKADPLQGGYMLQLEAMIADLNITEPFDSPGFVRNIQCYVDAVINNIQRRFPQPRLVSLMGYLDPRNVAKATPLNIMELADVFHLDGSKLWQEYLLYKPLAQTIEASEHTTALEMIVQTVLDPTNIDTMRESFPLISDLLSRLSILPVTSAQAERLFSAMKRIKTGTRNRLKTNTLHYLILASSEGPPIKEWDPIPAMRIWQNKGQHKIITFTHGQSLSLPSSTL